MFKLNFEFILDSTLPRCRAGHGAPVVSSSSLFECAVAVPVNRIVMVVNVVCDVDGSQVRRQGLLRNILD